MNVGVATMIDIMRGPVGSYVQICQTGMFDVIMCSRGPGIITFVITVITYEFMRLEVLMYGDILAWPSPLCRHMCIYMYVYVCRAI